MIATDSEFELAAAIHGWDFIEEMFSDPAIVGRVPAHQITALFERLWNGEEFDS